MAREDKTAITYSDNVIIRKYHPKDRQVIRTLCCNTAYFGESCESFFADGKLLADLIMKYNTDYEPEHIWVAEYEGKIVGYISACFNEARYSWIMLSKIIPFTFVKALIRGKIWSMKTYRLIVYNLKCFFSKETNLVKIDHERFPVHIHQNIKQGFRSKGIGSRLLIALLNEVEANKLPGIRFRALRQQPSFPFFEKYGFKQIDCKQVKSWESWFKKRPLYLMEYVREFNY